MAEEEDRANTPLSANSSTPLTIQPTHPSPTSAPTPHTTTTTDNYAGENGMNDEDLKQPSVECSICRESRPLSHFPTTPCNHKFCRLCLSTHYTRSIVQEGIVRFTCLDADCDRVIPTDELYRFIDATTQSKHSRFANNIALAQDPNVRWCVAADCDTPIRRTHKSQKRLECDRCGTAVCFDCAGPWDNVGAGKHECTVKSSTVEVERWAAQSRAQCALCPKCRARIEKTAGCNHMTCTYCKFEFCWLCRKEFKKGHYDMTNVFGGCPGGENAEVKPNKGRAACLLVYSCLLTCCLPMRMCWWRCNEQGLPWCCCWCCCQD